MDGSFCVKVTVSDDAHFLSCQVVAPVPSRGMHHLPLEVSQSRDCLWPSRHVELPDRTNEEIARDFVLGVELGVLACSRDLGLPLPGRVVPGRVLDCAVEPDVRIQVVLLGGADEIREDLLLAGVLTSPVRFLVEGIGVELRPDVAAAAGIFVVVPGACA